MKIQAFIFALPFLMGGCANLSTVDRQTDLPGGGKAIHLDAAQRLVYWDKDGHGCAEPTPDALQAFASSAAAGANVVSKGSVNLSDAFSANSQGVGLHTQSITLMRDMLYRICEQEQNGKISRTEVMQLLERAQDLTLGVLAIEQLTGAIVARQTPTSSTGSVTKQDDTTTQTTPSSPSAGVEAGTGHNGSSTPAVAAADQQQPTGSTTAPGATKGGSQQTSGGTDSATPALTARVTTTPPPNDQISAPLGTDKIQSIANATAAIVSLVVNKGHLTDSCMTYFNHFLDASSGEVELISKMNAADKQTISDVLEICKRIVDTDLQMQVAYYAKILPPNAAPPIAAQSNVTIDRYSALLPPQPPPPPPPARFEKVTLSASNLFSFGSANLTLPQPKLDEVAAALKADPSITDVHITGYTDRLGSAEYNQKLSQRRANAVRDYLISRGIDSSRLKAYGKGDRDPVVTDCHQKKRSEQIACLAPNRRVEIEPITVERHVN
jgi:outer membrane protein OmpA-like peptidoglycan-associated protein